jgi:NhaA family Na+:H+ antiporter
MKNVLSYLSRLGISFYLIVAVLGALLIANTRFEPAYIQFFQHLYFGKTFINWINEGLMTLFFFEVGIELNRACCVGEFRQRSNIILPGIAALGGMLVPALLYVVINQHSSIALQGWATPVATDIAFALGILKLFGRSVPSGLTLFLLALAIFDDLGAIIIIALFNTAKISYPALIMAIVLTIVLLFMKSTKVRYFRYYFLLGGCLWWLTLHSGIHATVSGVILGLCLPFDESKQTLSTLARIQTILAPLVGYIILPLFAFANAGLSFQDVTISVFHSAIALGIFCGLFFGKQVGVFLFASLVIKLGWAKMPSHTSWLALYGVTILCGIGFTMSLFLGTLAFQNEALQHAIEVKFAVLLASICAALFGCFVLGLAFRKKAGEPN